MIFDPKNGGVIFDIFDPHLPPPPPPHPPPNSLKTSKKWVSSGGVWWGGGGVQTQNSLGDAFIGQNNDFTRG